MTIARLKRSIEDLSQQIDRQHEKKSRLVDILHHYDAPTVDVYFELKVCQNNYQMREKEMERKMNIERLKKINERSKKRQSARNQRPTLPTKRPSYFASPKKPKMRTIRVGSPSTFSGRVFKGATFDIVYKAI